MSDLPPPVDEDHDRFATPPTLLPTDEVLFRFKRLIIAMSVAAAVLAVLPITPVVHVIVLMLLPFLVLVVAVSRQGRRQRRFVYRYTAKLWEFRRDRSTLVEAGDRAREPVRSGIRRAWLLLGLCVAVFLIGLVMAGVSAGISDGLYG